MKIKEVKKNLQLSGEIIIRWIPDDPDDPDDQADDETFLDVTQIPRAYDLCNIIRVYPIHPWYRDYPALCIELAKDW